MPVSFLDSTHFVFYVSAIFCLVFIPVFHPHPFRVLAGLLWVFSSWPSAHFRQGWPHLCGCAQICVYGLTFTLGSFSLPSVPPCPFFFRAPSLFLSRLQRQNKEV